MSGSNERDEHEIAAIVDALRTFFVTEMLDGEDDVELTASTPILAYGLVNSLSIVELARFVLERFAVRVPVERWVPEHLENLEAIAGLVVDLRRAAGPGREREVEA